MQTLRLLLSPCASTSPENKRSVNLRQDVQVSLIDGTCYSLMVGMGETYIPAFVIAVGLGEVTGGLIATLPLLAGAFFQLLSPIMVAHLGSYRKWVVLCAALQCLSFLPLVAASFYGYLPAAAVYLIATLYWGTSMSLGACWSSWTGILIPSTCRTSFFAGRARLTQVGAMVGFLLGGIILHLHEGAASWQFAAIFFLSFLFRAGSVYCLSKQTDVKPPERLITKNIPLSNILRCFNRSEPAGKLLIYLLCVQLGVQISSPFITPLILKGLKFGYWQFALLIASSYAAKTLVLPLFARRVQKNGPHSLLWFGGTGIIILPLLWMISKNFWILMGSQAINGFFWAAFELASTLLILDKVPPRERISVLTKYNVANALVMALGSLLGASILDACSRQLSGYYLLLITSTVSRAATLILLSRLVEVKPKWINFHIPSVRIINYDGFITPFQGWTNLLKLKRPAKKPVKKTVRRKAA